MANLVTCLHSVIMIIPGIGFINGGMILGEIGDTPFLRAKETACVRRTGSIGSSVW
jgi:transposase